MFNKLDRPFPDRSGLKESILNIAGVGVFVSLFLFFIRPFGIDGSMQDMIIACIGFGFVTVVFGSIFELVFRYVLPIKADGPNWTLGKWIIMCVVLVLWIALGNFLYMNVLSGWRGWSFLGLGQMMMYTSVIGVFPVVFSGLVLQMRAENQNEQSATEVEARLKPASVGSMKMLPAIELKDNEQLIISVDDFRYGEAMQNYVHIWHNQNGSLVRSTARITMTKLQEFWCEDSILRCHRSYLVNTRKVLHVKGNAQGLKLQLDGVDEFEVPVSRSFIPALKSALN